MECFEGGLVGVVVLQHGPPGAGVDAAASVYGHGGVDGDALGVVVPIPTSQLPQEGTLGYGVRQYLIHFSFKIQRYSSAIKFHSVGCVCVPGQPQGT
eukprot:1157248-Pelagomonas_calceolata.AAC.5